MTSNANDGVDQHTQWCCWSNLTTRHPTLAEKEEELHEEELVFLAKVLTGDRPPCEK